MSDCPSRITWAVSSSKSVHRTAALMIQSRRSSGSSENSMTSGATTDNSRPMASPSCRSEPKFSTGRWNTEANCTFAQRSNSCSVEAVASAWKSSPPCSKGVGSSGGCQAAVAACLSNFLSKSSMSWAFANISSLGVPSTKTGNNGSCKKRLVRKTLKRSVRPPAMSMGCSRQRAFAVGARKRNSTQSRSARISVSRSCKQERSAAEKSRPSF
mmetsp:Transcript_26879/g.76972  ORF Transcript_26879/g.76972 Transcript_26879/m.76972 type:complete len:213 (+) Transcript_26879:128-766(+)